jgi:hypothetical protein
MPGCVLRVTGTQPTIPHELLVEGARHRLSYSVSDSEHFSDAHSMALLPIKVSTVTAPEASRIPNWNFSMLRVRISRVVREC